MDVRIRKSAEADERTGDFINREFSDYAHRNGVDLRFEEFCFTAEDGEGNLLGVITGRAYYNEVHIDDLIIGEQYRGLGLGSRLVAAVEEAFRGKGYDVVTLTTFGFQAPDFYPRLGYRVEYVREDPDPRLSKYFLSKKL